MYTSLLHASDADTNITAGLPSYNAVLLFILSAVYKSGYCHATYISCLMGQRLVCEAGGNHPRTGQNVLS